MQAAMEKKMVELGFTVSQGRGFENKNCIYVFSMESLAGPYGGPVAEMVYSKFTGNVSLNGRVINLD